MGISIGHLVLLGNIKSLIVEGSTMLDTGNICTGGLLKDD